MRLGKHLCVYQMFKKNKHVKSTKVHGVSYKQDFSDFNAIPSEYMCIYMYVYIYV